MRPQAMLKLLPRKREAAYTTVMVKVEINAWNTFVGRSPNVECFPADKRISGNCRGLHQNHTGALTSSSEC